MTSVEVMCAADARTLTDRIKVGVEAIWELIKQAYTERAWAALGYKSWDDYCTREFGTSRLRLPREERSEVVASLRESGLSIRAIAAATGDSIGTVHDAITCSELNTSDPQPITGTDGKTYTPKPRPEPTPPSNYFDSPAEEANAYAMADLTDEEFKDALAQAREDGDLSAENVIRHGHEIAPGFTADDLSELNTPKAPAPRRKPITDQARDAGWELRKAVERIQRIAADDRFDASTEKVAPHLRGHLTNAIDSCQAVLDRLTQKDS